MGGDYHRAVTGQDVLAAASVAGLGEAVRVRLAEHVASGDRFDSTEDLAVAAGPMAIGLSHGRWNATFTPLFGEFE
jgi:hypothetical protein